MAKALTKRSKKTPPKKKEEKTPKIKSDSYNQFKLFAGQQYTGMKVGGHHKWYYDAGEWKETKRTPDLWEMHYNVSKRRAGKAPEGSGVPVGTEYNWCIVAFQNVRKIDANTYTTSMNGLKFKVAHKRAGSEKWSSSYVAQRKRLIKFMQVLLESLRKEDVLESKGAKNRKAPKELSFLQ